MSIFNKAVSEIDLADLKSLVEDHVEEGKEIDYKRELPGRSDKDKVNFLKDVASFANAAGGWLIYGIEQNDQGLPANICGLENIVFDDESRRLTDIILNNIKPKLNGFQFQKVENDQGKIVIVLRIPKSWSSPHVISFDKFWRFYTRVGSQNHPLEVDELRRAFALSETTGEKISNFRLDRLAKIMGGETPVPLPPGPKIVLHLIPLISFEPGVSFDVISLRTEIHNLPTVDSSNFNSLINFDGLCTYEFNRADQEYLSYLQFFRRGVMESVGTWNFYKCEDTNCVAIEAIEKNLIVNLPRYFRSFQRLDIEPPIIVMLSFLEIKGHRIIFGHDTRTLINKNDLLLPELMLTDYQTDPAEFLRPRFDQIWNAGGWPRSMYYDENGKRK